MEAAEVERVERKTRAEGSYCGGRLASVGARPGTSRKYSDNLNDNNNDRGNRSGGAEAPGWVASGARGMLDSLGGFLGTRKGSADSMDNEIELGKMKRSSRTETNKAVSWRFSSLAHEYIECNRGCLLCLTL